MTDWSQAEILVRRYKLNWMLASERKASFAWPPYRLIVAPKPRSAKTFALFVHEIGHIARAKGRVPASEENAWRFVRKTAREFGFPKDEVDKTITQIRSRKPIPPSKTLLRKLGIIG